MIESKLPLALGCMGLSGTWNPAELDAERELNAIRAFEAALDAGFTLFDHADIYGAGSCEEVFHKCLHAVPGVRERIHIWTKGGIRAGNYNLSAAYLRERLDISLARMGVDYVDLYQIHRPDMLTHPSETAGFLNEALREGKIRAIGVSNYFPEQMRALQQWLEAPIVSNQIELHLLRPAPFYEGWEFPGSGNTTGAALEVGDGTLDYCLLNSISPLAYSPLARAKLSKNDATDAREKKVQAAIGELAKKYDATRTQIALAWLLKHPSGIIPVVGSTNPDHIREAAGAASITLEHEEWYQLFAASWGRNMP